LTNFDRACLVAKYNSNYKRETVNPEIFKKGYTEAQIKYLRKSLGKTMNVSCDIEFTKEYNEYPDYYHFNFVMTTYHTWNKSGACPFPGSVSEQPGQIMDIFDLLFQLDMEREEDMRRKAEKDRKRNG
jgi:hypothetical protein